MYLMHEQLKSNSGSKISELRLCNKFKKVFIFPAESLHSEIPFLLY